MEIEIPRRLTWYMLSILLVIGPLLIGILASPHAEDDRPVLLTPRLARLNEYRRDVRSWVKVLQEADVELATLLEEPSDDLFDQNARINRVYQYSKQLIETIDQTAIPPTFEPLHELLGEVAKAYLETAALVARWISEPGDENRQAAGVALSSAHELLNRLYANPWIEVEP
jgi:hypothetical protein